MKITRQTRNNIMKRPDIFGNSNAIFRVPLQKLAIFLRCKERDEGKGKRETKGTATPLENPSQASQDYLSDGTPDWCHSAGMMVAGNTSTNPAGGDGSASAACCVLATISCT
jgi:hypothetical protein